MTRGRTPNRYELRNGEPFALSFGADGVDGGAGADADIMYPDPEEEEAAYSDSR